MEYMSFSAHADAKGIMQLIRMAEPRNMVLVHGEAVKMEFLKGKIEQEFSKCVSVRSIGRGSRAGGERVNGAAVGLTAGCVCQPQASTATCLPMERRPS